MNWESQDVMGYAETRRTRARVARPASVAACQEALTFARREGATLCPRGMGYSYADEITNHDQLILDMSALNRIRSWDPAAGRLVADPGVTFAQIFQTVLPDNWTLASCPGGMLVTLGGALSNNVHGKDSWQNGNFGRQVEEFKLLVADGTERRVRRDTQPDLFQAVIGGMGVLGLITEVTLQLKKVPSAYVATETYMARDYRELLDMLEQAKVGTDFAVAWVDAFATGRRLGRGFVTRARWVAEAPPATPARLARSLHMPTRIFNILPARPTWFLARPLFQPFGIMMTNHGIHALNALRTRLPGRGAGRLLFTDYNFMHNKIPDLKHVYRPAGFLEFQPLIPSANGPEPVAELLRLCQKHGCESLLCGVKTHREDEFMISYAGQGYSVGIDIQVRSRRPEAIRDFARAVFAYTADCGGRVFLSKDEMLMPDLFRRMYPRHAEFQAVKAKVDPQGLFCSDMYRRLFAPA